MRHTQPSKQTHCQFELVFIIRLNGAFFGDQVPPVHTGSGRQRERFELVITTFSPGCLPQVRYLQNYKQENIKQNLYRQTWYTLIRLPLLYNFHAIVSFKRTLYWQGTWAEMPTFINTTKHTFSLRAHESHDPSNTRSWAELTWNDDCWRHETQVIVTVGMTSWTNVTWNGTDSVR